MKTNDKISKDLKFKGNPRIISEKQKDLLQKHIEELGDLSGVVYCHNQKAYVGGNQRTDIFDGNSIEIVETYKKPNEVGTVAYGFINHNNERFAYREVKFSKEQFKEACVIANNSGGSNDWQVLNTDEWKAISEKVGLELMEIEDEVNINEIETADGFSLPDGEKSPFQQMAFNLADEQVTVIKNAISEIKETEEYKYVETFGNENSNGNSLYLIISQWAAQKK